MSAPVLDVVINLLPDGMTRPPTIGLICRRLSWSSWRIKAEGFERGDAQAHGGAIGLDEGDSGPAEAQIDSLLVVLVHPPRFIGCCAPDLDEVYAE